MIATGFLLELVSEVKKLGYSCYEMRELSWRQAPEWPSKAGDEQSSNMIFGDPWKTWFKQRAIWVIILGR